MPVRVFVGEPTSATHIQVVYISMPYFIGLVTLEPASPDPTGMRVRRLRVKPPELIYPVTAPVILPPSDTTPLLTILAPVGI